MTDSLMSLAALAGAGAAAGLAMSQGTRRWGRWVLRSAALALLASPWLLGRRTFGAVMTVTEALAYVAALATVWVLSHGGESRATLVALAGGIAGAAALELWAPCAPMDGPRALWPLLLQMLCGAGAGVALGAAVRGLHGDDVRGAERAGQLVLAFASAAWLGSLVVRQAHTGVVWGWDVLAMWHLVCWLASAVVSQALAQWRMRPLLERLLLACLGLLLLAQSALTAALLGVLGTVSTWIAG